MKALTCANSFRACSSRFEEDAGDPLEADLGEAPPGLVQPELGRGEPGLFEEGEVVRGFIGALLNEVQPEQA